MDCCHPKGCSSSCVWLQRTRVPGEGGGRAGGGVRIQGVRMKKGVRIKKGGMGKERGAAHTIEYFSPPGLDSCRSLLCGAFSQQGGVAMSAPCPHQALKP